VGIFVGTPFNLGILKSAGAGVLTAWFKYEEEEIENLEWVKQLRRQPYGL
jgi:hypothetical protein